MLPRPARGAFLAALLLAAGAACAAAVERYVALNGAGEPIGEQVVTSADDGSVAVRYTWKDNGRGPEIDERLRLAPDGMLLEYRAGGSAEMGGPIDERFERSGARARWQSTSERGEAVAPDDALYVPIDGSLQMRSVALGRFAARGGAPLPLLPGGTLTQRVLDELDIDDGAGRTRRVRLVAWTGLQLTPELLWSTTDAQPRLFAQIYAGWWSLVEDGWQRALPRLLEHQERASETLLAELARELREPLPGLTVIRNARVFDSERARLEPLRDVYLLRERITAVRPAGTPWPVRPDAEIDAAGRVLLPGLYDMHGHVDRWDGLQNLAAGVTTVRDLGNNNARLQRLLDEQAAGRLLLPRVEPAGFIEGRSPFASQSGIHVSDAAQAKAAVDWYAARGYRQIKIYNSFPRDALRATAAHAHRLGLRVSGHVPAFMRAAEAVEAGFDEIQHINQVMLNFLVKPDTDTRTLTRFYLPAQLAADLDFNARPVRDFVALLRSRRTVVDPTLATFGFIQQRAGEETLALLPGMAERLPTTVARASRTGGMDIPDDATAARYRASYRKMAAFVAHLYRAGVPLVAGTDSYPGFGVHAELAQYVAAGLTPAQALQIATRDGARVSGTAHERGRIAPGRLADLVLVDGDPTRDIAALGRVALVITQGAAFPAPRLLRAIGVEPPSLDVPALQRLGR